MKKLFFLETANTTRIVDSEGGVVVESIDLKTAMAICKAVNVYDAAKDAVQFTNDTIYAKGLVVGSDDYFRVREKLCEVIRAMKGL